MLGVRYDSKTVGTGFGVPRHRTEERPDLDTDLYGYLHEEDRIDATKEVPRTLKNYKQRLQRVQAISTHSEIEFITHRICNEAIVSDEYGKFCTVDIKPAEKGVKWKAKLKESVEAEFDRIYGLWDFDNNSAGWSTFLKFIEEGSLCYEIIWDDITNPGKIVGFTELDPQTMVPIWVTEMAKDDNGDNVVNTDGDPKILEKLIWRQILDDTNGSSHRRNRYSSGGGVHSKGEFRTIPDENIIFLSYSRTPGNTGRISYLERLVRSFNIMRTIENCTVAWYIMNSQSRIRMIIPVSTKNAAKAKQSLAQVKARYKEDINIDQSSGEVTVNGQPRINFSRNFILPSRSGQKPEIDSFKMQGQDLTRMDAVEYFAKKLYRDSGLPFSRFDRGSGGGNVIEFNQRGPDMDYDTRNFHLMVNRMRSEFKQLIIKPLALQLIRMNPDIAADPQMVSQIGIRYNSDNEWEQSMEITRQIQALEQMGKFTSVRDAAGQDVFSRKFLLVDKFAIMTEEEWQQNDEARTKEYEEGAKLEKIKRGGR
jgi:hypothetical protein